MIRYHNSREIINLIFVELQLLVSTLSTNYHQICVMVHKLSNNDYKLCNRDFQRESFCNDRSYLTARQ